IGELCASNTLWKARIVVQPLGQSRLTTEAGTLYDKHVDALARRVDRRREAGRSAADDDTVVERTVRPSLQSELGGKLSVRRLHLHRPIWKENRRNNTLAAVSRLNATQPL